MDEEIHPVKEYLFDYIEKSEKKNQKKNSKNYLPNQRWMK
jgi:hypothetical protein